MLFVSLTSGLASILGLAIGIPSGLALGTGALAAWLLRRFCARREQMS